MISNQRQYNVTKGQLLRLTETLDLSKKKKGKMDDRIYKAMIAGIKSQIDELVDQMGEFEAMQNAKSLLLQSLKELPDVLIKARVAKGLTQKDLAEKLNLKVQQIQRYEKTRYSSVSFKRVVNIFEALDIDVEGEISMQ